MLRIQTYSCIKCPAGDGVVDQEEYRDFWHYVGGYRWVTDEELDRYFDHMTEVCGL